MIKVLLVEDNDVDAELTQDLLSEWSMEEFQITRAKTLTEGFLFLSRDQFDAVLLDLSLPDAFGLPTVRQVHAMNPAVPVVVLSGVTDQSLALQAVQQGAQDYLVKGQGHPELLARAIRYAIERKRAEEHLTHLAQYDHLTGLVNRNLFRDRLIQAMARSKRMNQSIGLMLLDLDRFKTVNDTFGHTVGDELLQQVAAQFGRGLRKSDLLARLGGDEFAVIADASHCDALVPVAERLIAMVSLPLIEGQGDRCISASIGLACYPLDASDGTALLSEADAAMYHAKRAGKGRVVRAAEAVRTLTPALSR